MTTTANTQRARRFTAAFSATVLLGGVACAVSAPAQASVSTVNVSNRVLYIDANDAASHITIRSNGAQTTVTDTDSGDDWAFQTANLNRIVFRGGDAADELDGTGTDVAIFASGRAGSDTLIGGDKRDTLVGGAGVDTLDGRNEDDTLVGIDGGVTDHLTGGNGRDVYWRDQSGNQKDHVTEVSQFDYDNSVSAFNNVADKTLDGDNLADPAAPAGMVYRAQPTVPLFGVNGPTGRDVFQGGISDCKVVSSLSAMANNTVSGNAWPVRRAMADFGDGTFGVRLGSRFYRVDNQLIDNGGSLYGAAANNVMWVAIAEKAIAFHDKVVPSAPFDRLASTSPATVMAGFGSASTATPRMREFASNATQYGNRLFTRWNGYQNVVVTLTSQSTVGGVHAYTVWNVVRNARGEVTRVQLRNPWGDADGNVGYRDANPSDAMVTKTPAQLFVDAGGRVNWGTAVN